MGRPTNIQVARVFGRVQRYSWGKVSPHSLVGQIGGVSEVGVPCAELWYGTHLSAPSLVTPLVATDNLAQTDSGRSDSANCETERDPLTLSEYIGSIQAGPPRSLSFLLKILSINEPLSIQAHPDRERAQELHRKFPEFYPDASHKPEIAIALTPLTLLHGFRSLEELASIVNMFPQFGSLIGLDDVLALQLSPAESIRRFYGNLLHAAAEVRSEVVASVLNCEGAAGEFEAEVGWIKRSAALHGSGDVGVLCFLLMNLQSIQPDEAIYTPPNTLHAYLEGDIVECMAASDNVVRAGLTQKHQDVETLLSMLDYTPGLAKVLRPERTAGGGPLHYSVPAEEFQIVEFSGTGGSNVPWNGQCPLLLLSVDGEGTLTVGSGDYDQQDYHLDPGCALFLIGLGVELRVPITLHCVSGRVFVVSGSFT